MAKIVGMYVKFNTNLLHNTSICYSMLRHVSAWAFSSLQGAFCGMCSICFNLFVRNSTYDWLQLLWWLGVTILKIGII